MRKLLVIALMFFSWAYHVKSQSLVCPSPYVYMDGAVNILAYDPGQALSSTNPFSTTITAFGSGLALMPNINGGTLTPTFYTTSSGTYWYWSGSAWVNTGHTIGNSGALNIAGCGGTLYGLVGTNGQVYAYNGTGNAALLTTISNFNGGGPYDLVTDCNCNFYALNTSSVNPGLYLYNSSGALVCTYTLNGMPASTGGGGFAIIGNQIYVRNSGFYTGTITPTGVNFTSVSGFTTGVGDFASCPVCNPTPSINATITGGTITCANPSISLSVNTTVTPVTYSWTGPAILGNPSGTSVVVAAPGIYSCSILTSSCPAAELTLTTSVISNSSIVGATLNLTGNVCMQANSNVTLKVSHTSTAEAINWIGPASYSVSGIDSVNVNTPGVYTVVVTNTVNGCFASQLVSLIPSPTVQVTVSDNTLCLYPYNNSPATITLTPSGALSYTLYTSTNFSTSAPNGTSMPCFATTLSGNLATLATATLMGANATCVDTTAVSFSIIPNPIINLPQSTGSICPGGSQAFVVSGASVYNWAGGAGLSTLTGSAVVASPNISSQYSVKGSDNGCNSATKNVTVTVFALPTLSISPANSTICAGTTATLQVIGNATSYTWSPMGFVGTQCTVNPGSNQSYTVTGSLNGCNSSISSQVTVMTPPVISLALSSYSVCAQNYNNSPHSITITPSGATNYTFVSGGNVSVISPNGPLIQVVPIAPAPLVPTWVSSTLTGVSGVCRVSITQTFVIKPNPDIAISPPVSTVCPGQKQTFQVSGANNYTWLPGNYTLTALNTIIASPTITSFYSVVGEHAGCFSSVKSAVLVILPIPSVSVTVSSPTVCAGSAVQMSITGNGGSFFWLPVSSVSPASGATVFAHPSTTQVYTVVASLNTCTNQAVVTISAIPIPTVVALAAQPTVCSGGSTIIKAFGANTFQWLPVNSLNVASGNEVVATPNSSTTYTIKGFNGICTGTGSVFIKTINRPNMMINASANQICKGGSIPITANGAQSYTWAPSSALLSSPYSSMVIASPLASTNYTVFGSNITGSTSCYQQLSYSVIVASEIIPYVSASSYSICKGDKVSLQASGGNTFSWTPAQGLNAGLGAGAVASPTSNVVYTVNVSQNNLCGANATVLVTVNENPWVFAGNDTIYNLNDEMMIRARGTGTMVWVSGDGVTCKVCPETQIFPTNSGCYYIETVNDYGCKATDVVCIELTKDFTIYLPNTFTPNNDGINDVFLLYGDGITEISIQVFDRWGELLFHSSDYTQGWDGTYKNNLCPGGTYTYLVKYTGLDRKKYTKKGHILLAR